MRVRISFSKGFFPLLLSSLLIIILCFAGCAEDSSILNNGKSQQLEFSVKTCNWNSSSDYKPVSRATPISRKAFDTSESFNVIADVNNGGNWSTEVNNELVSYSTGNKIWQTTATHYWPGTGSTVDFYVYYPTSISSKVTHATGSVPVLSYTVPDNAADQIDILTFSKAGVAGDSYSQTPVDFKHIFAAVQFSVGSSGLPSGTISSITISGIKNSGVYTFGSGWTLNSGTTTFKVSPSTVINGISGENITSGTYTFLIIPQTFSNATITLNYSNGTTFSTTISGTWTAGNTYTYQLSKSVVYNFDYTGDVQTFTAPYTGTYKLEVWGGGSNEVVNTAGNTTSVGKGGYATGVIHLSSKEKLYICIGGAGTTNNGLTGGSGGYNGGGTGGTGASYAGGSGGGGATHIATTNRGLLSNYSSYKDEVLIVAGGSGGNAVNSSSGSGGGVSGGNSVTAGWSATGVSSTTINGGTQTIGYAFGKGQNGSVKSLGGMAGAEGNGGGGGGWHGGYSYIGDGDGSCSGGSGGSGYLGGVTYGSMQNGVRSGNGYARITFISAN